MKKKKNVQVEAKSTTNYNQTFVKKEVIFTAFFISAGLVFFY
jgi:hypothetical protein